MTAHSEITGTLTPPAHICGKFGNYPEPERIAARREWVGSLPHHIPSKEIALALGIHRTTVNKILQEVRPPVIRHPSRREIYNRGIVAGFVKAAVLNGMTWEQQDALEAHCARTGQTMAEALVELWATVHAAREAQA